MTSVEEIRNKVLDVCLPQRLLKKRPLMFYIQGERAAQIPNLLPDEERSQLDSALQQTDICSSIQDLNEKLKANPGEILFRRVAGFVNNDIRARLLQDQGYSPKVVISGESGIYNALLVAKSISLVDALRLISAESRSIKEAREKYQGGMLIAQTIGEVNQQAGVVFEETVQTLTGYRWDVRIGEDSKKLYIGAYGGSLETNLEDLRQIDKRAHFSPLNDPEAPLHTPLLSPFLGNFQTVLDKLDIQQPDIIVIGGKGSRVATIEEIKEEIIRQTTGSYNAQLIDDALSSLHRPLPFEVGLEPKDHTKKYLIGAFVAGIGAVGILALIRLRTKNNSKLG